MSTVKPIAAAITLVLLARPANPAPPTTGTLATAQGPTSAELRIDGAHHARLRLTDLKTGERRALPLVMPDDVLPLLMDRRLSFLWPAITDWAGTDLSRLRGQLETDSAAAFAEGRTLDRRTNAAFVDGRIAVIADRAKILSATGHADEAIRLLVGKLDSWTPKGALARGDESMLVITLHSLLLAANRSKDAEIRLAAFEREAQSRGEILNALANHAMLQAMTGRYSDALATVDRMAAMYGSYQKTIGGMITTIPGSERHVAVIRACALHGLGRGAEAQAQLDLLAGAKTPASLIFEVDPNIVFRRRAAFCMGDAPRLAAALAESLGEAPLSSDLATYLNPHRRDPLDNPVLLDAARAQPVYAAAARDIVRPLPAELAAASHDWRD